MRLFYYVIYRVLQKGLMDFKESIIVILRKSIDRNHLLHSILKTEKFSNNSKLFTKFTNRYRC